MNTLRFAISLGLIKLSPGARSTITGSISLLHGNLISTKTVKITISAEKSDKSIATLFSGTVQITDDDLTVEEVIKKVCDERGILYSISGGFINSIGEYANDFGSAYAWWSSGFMVNGEEYVNYAGVNEEFVGDGAEIYVNYRYGTF